MFVGNGNIAELILHTILVNKVTKHKLHKKTSLITKNKKYKNEYLTIREEKGYHIMQKITVQ